jgi:2-iminobutanoate/2-iminopropanoate deaminase
MRFRARRSGRPASSRSAFMPVLRFAALALPFAALAGCQPAGSGAADASMQQEAAPEVQYITTPEMESMGFPFSDAVRVGHMLYLSGQVGAEPGKTTLVEGGIQAQTRQALENIKATLERNGSSMDRVVKCTVILDDMSQWPAMNEVYATFFPGHKPARTAIGASGLAIGAAVEIECWATVG